MYVCVAENRNSKREKFTSIKRPGLIQGHPPSCQRFATSTTHQALLCTDSLKHAGGFPYLCTN